MSNHNETGSPNRREEGSSAGCLALQSGEEVTRRLEAIKKMDLESSSFAKRVSIAVELDMNGWAVV
ncbi:MAG: hypothetical protein EF813_04405 [Methanosarcinales archaeon]|nr:MAG: hypothetical protein EF813_04405 [Methanosarcinales archaeon]